MNCRVCGEEMKLLEVLKNKTKDTTTLYKKPFAAHKKDIELYRCPVCTHMQIDWLVPDSYYDDYTLISEPTEEGEKGKYTEHLLTYCDSLFSRLAKYAKTHNSILDIGCGAGVLLNYEKKYFKKVVGVEPSKTQYDIAMKINCGGGVNKQIINSYFSRELNLEKEFSAFVSTQVFEHITVIREALEYAYDLLESGGVGLIEVPNGQKMYYEQSYYDVFTDHVNYFTPMSLCTLANQYGFEIISVSEEFNRNHMSLFLRKPYKELRQMTDVISDDADKLNEILGGYRRVSVWGAGAKARSFVQLIKDKTIIKHYWDINRLTWNQYLDGLYVPITEPNADEINDSDVILIFAAAFTDEIIYMLKTNYGYHGDVVRFDGEMSIQPLS